MPRMRTAPGVLEIIKEQDPNTEVTLHYLRTLLRSKPPPVPTLIIGRKKLVDADAVIAYIATGSKEKTGPVTSGIRKVEERIV